MVEDQWEEEEGVEDQEEEELRSHSILGSVG